MSESVNAKNFWNRFDRCLELKMKEEQAPSKKEFFARHNLSFSSYDNARRIGRVPITDIVVKYALLFNVSADWLLLGEEKRRLSVAQSVLADNPDIEEIVYALKDKPELIGFIKTGLGL